MKNKELIIIAGPTGIGKTSLSVSIAGKLNTEIISADSRQIYREMKIGTAVPDDSELQAVPHHFIRTISIHDYYNASRYENDVLNLLDDLFTKYDKVILTGGSGLYIDAVRKGIDDLPEIDPEIRKQLFQKLEKEGLESLRNDLRILDPVSYAKIDLKNPKRVQKALEVSIMTGKPYSAFLQSAEKQRNFKMKLIALDMDRKQLYDRINQRVLKMIKKGWVEEARELLPYKSNNALNTVGYKEIFMFLEGKIKLDEAIAAIQSSTRKYARKQLTWLRKEPGYMWFHPDETEKIMNYISQDE